MTYRSLLGIATIVLVVTCGWSFAQEKGVGAAQRKAPAAAGSKAKRADDELAIRSASLALAQAFEAGDAKAFTALFTEEAEYDADDGEPVHGRVALANAYKQMFETSKTVKAQTSIDSIRFLGKDTAIEEGTFTVTVEGSAPNESRYSALHVREGGKWLIALLKEWDDDTPSRPTLEDLSWLIGTWESNSEELTARTTYEWTANKNFIKVTYDITPKNEGESSSGTQVIGIDPAIGQIRSWLFASDGAIGESTWVLDGDRWMIESVGTLVDGTSTTAVNFLSRSGDDAFSWRSVLRTHAGVSQPDLAAITVKRVASAGDSLEKDR